MNFSYLFVEQSQDSIDIENIGQVCLSVFNDEGAEYYLKIKTEYGWSKILQFGPIKSDFKELESGLYLSYSNIEYNEKRLYKIIDDFLNNDKRKVTQAFEISEDDFEEKLSYLTDHLGG